MFRQDVVGCVLAWLDDATERGDPDADAFRAVLAKVAAIPPDA